MSDVSETDAREARTTAAGHRIGRAILKRSGVAREVTQPSPVAFRCLLWKPIFVGRTVSA
jgi:hypothetical protein